MSLLGHKFTVLSSLWTVSCLSICKTGHFLGSVQRWGITIPSHSGKVKAIGHELLLVTKWQRKPMHTPHTHISTCICILVQINGATAFQAKLLTHCHLISMEEQVRLNWKMLLNCQWDCALRRVSFSQHQLYPDGIKSVLFSGLDSDSWQLFISIYFRFFGDELFYLREVTGCFCFPWACCWERSPSTLRLLCEYL